MSQLVAPALGLPSLGKSNASLSIGSRSPLSHLGTPQANTVHAGTSGAATSSGPQGSGIANGLGASGSFSSPGLARSGSLTGLPPGTGAFTPPSQASRADGAQAFLEQRSRSESLSQVARDVSPRQLRDASPRHMRSEGTWAGPSQPLLERSPRSEPLTQPLLERSARSEPLGQVLRDNSPQARSHAGSSHDSFQGGSMPPILGQAPSLPAMLATSGADIRTGRSDTSGSRGATHPGYVYADAGEYYYRMVEAPPDAAQLKQRRLVSTDPLPFSASPGREEFDVANPVDLGGPFEAPSGPPSLPSELSTPHSQTPQSSHPSRSYSQATSVWVGEVPQLMVSGPVDLTSHEVPQIRSPRVSILEGPTDSEAPDLNRRHPHHDHLRAPVQMSNDEASSVSSASSIPAGSAPAASAGQLAPALTPQGEAAQRERVLTEDVLQQRRVDYAASRSRSLSHIPASFSVSAGPRLDFLTSKVLSNEVSASTISPTRSMPSNLGRRSSMPDHPFRAVHHLSGPDHPTFSHPSKMIDVDLTGDSPTKARESRSGSEIIAEAVLEAALEPASAMRRSFCGRCGRTWAIPEPYGGECPDCNVPVDVIEFELPVQSQRHSQALSSSASLLPQERAREHQSLAGSSMAEGSVGLPAANSEEGSDGLTQALSAFGAPNEWWHDSIILGRLSALALRYFAAKGARKLWQAWRACVRESLRKNEVAIRHRTRLAVRLKASAWRAWLTTLAKFGRKMEGFHKLQSVIQRKLKPSWARLQQAVFLRRDISRRLRLLYLIERKMLQMLARAHYYQRLLRLGFAGLWLATQVPLAGPKQQSSQPRDLQSADTAMQAPLGHVSQVIRRVWRRWCFATQMWLSSAEYNMRQTEAWLTGEITTPRSIVTSNVLEVISPGAQNTSASGLSQGFLGYGGRWRFDGMSGGAAGASADPVSPDQTSMNFEDVQTPPFELPFATTERDVRDSASSSPSYASPPRSMMKRGTVNASAAEADAGSMALEYEDGPVHLSAQTPSLQGSASSLQARATRMRPPRQKQRKLSEELALPPHRTRRSLIFKAAEEAAVPRGRQHAEASPSRGRQDSEVPLTEGLSPRGDMNFSAAEDATTPDAMSDSVAIGTRSRSASVTQPRPRDSFRSEQDVMEFVDPEASPKDVSGDFSFTRAPGPAPAAASGPSFLQRPQTKVDPLLMQESAGDYWSVRSRFGPAAAVRPVALRQRC